MLCGIDLDLSCCLFFAGVNTTYYGNITLFNMTQVPLIHNRSQAIGNRSNASFHRTSPSDEFFR